jgi:flavin reductase (DIM6/NTAB) family NADH-FMN oxidoreductase RutF
MPSGLYLLGARAVLSDGGDTRNLMTLNWATQVSTDPKLVAVSVERDALTHRLVEEGRAFSLSLLHRADRSVVRAFVRPAVWDPAAGTLGGHPVTEAVTGAPILGAAASWVDCRLHHTLECGTHSLFVGEVVDAGEAVADPGAVTAPLEVLRMEDTRMNYGG